MFAGRMCPVHVLGTRSMVSKQSAPAQPGSQSISRAIYLLSVVAAEGKTGGARLSAIAEKTGLHIASR